MDQAQRISARFFLRDKIFGALIATARDKIIVGITPELEADLVALASDLTSEVWERLYRTVDAVKMTQGHTRKVIRE